MTYHRLDNADYFMRAQRAAQAYQAAYQAAPYQAMLNQAYQAAAYQASILQQQSALQQQTARSAEPQPTPGEREREDVTGLRLLDEFLEKRKHNKGA